MKFPKKTLYVLSMAALAVSLTACGNKPTETPSATANTKSGAAATAAPAATSAATPAATATAAANAPKQWSKAPDMTIDQNKTYTAEVTTSKGKFTIELFAKEAPKTVNNFVFLSKQGFYENVTFHRIIKSFMVQTGDPTGTGRGGPGYRFEDELKTTHQYEPGIVAMANAGPNTNGSQFFICTGDDSKGLNSQPNYTIFGRVTEGMDVVQQIADTPVLASGEGSTPKEKVTITSVAITEK
ncbi:peptidylprolyl isomerase [Paenibacillus hexagrammi]|uniref:Peptidyl-prolyl cis-trans isomerase n=1 Tax=Paenibacillus hexagrammi TaxID=2908839 RepID=A0ABY3SSL7_9BACL|nr:peptidylprolyl isomerase [Paenibacillus sp. YPD9-1]UJF36016.1 peptidylprolyl isomerase [Paenibacillus sp. YPD9-1]